jgi:hypothetical protein
MASKNLSWGEQNKRPALPVEKNVSLEARVSQSLECH